MSFPIIEKLGGWAAAEAILAERGVSYSKEARKKWQAPDRAQLPRDVAIALGAEASARGVAFDPDDFSFVKTEAA